jgi:hypothetical protein
MGEGRATLVMQDCAISALCAARGHAHALAITHERGNRKTNRGASRLDIGIARVERELLDGGRLGQRVGFEVKLRAAANGQSRWGANIRRKQESCVKILDIVENRTFPLTNSSQDMTDTRSKYRILFAVFGHCPSFIRAHACASCVPDSWPPQCARRAPRRAPSAAR